MLAVLFLVQFVMAQSVPEGVKLLQYVYKNNSAKAVLQKAYDANPKDPQAIYWLGIANVAKNREVLSKDGVAAARAIYQKALQDGVNDPLIWVGQGTMDILDGNNVNAAKQKFEQAITSTTETKGKNKGKPSAAILNAIGFANSLGSSTMGDPLYGIEKLKQAATIDLNSSDIYYNMGVCYLKLGGENGGEAVKALQEADLRDTKSGRAKWRTGKIYQSQNNKESLELFFNGAIQAEPAFPAPYLELFNYYANRDVAKAKGYLDDFLKYADKDPINDFFYAEYLFRAGKYSESLAKAKEIEASAGLAAVPRLSLLYAYNYDRLGDSVKAKDNVVKFFNAKLDIQSSDYDLAVKLLSKFPGNEAQAVGYLEQAIGNDTSRVNKLNYMNQAADIYGKGKMYKEQLFWMRKVVEAKGTMGEGDYYRLTSAALNAKDIPQTIELAKKYMTAYPDKPQPYSFFKKAAIASDPDTTSGSGVEHLQYLDSVYTVVNKEKFKKDIFLNEYYSILYYISKTNTLKKSPDFKVKSDGTRTPVVDQFLDLCQKGLLVTDSMLQKYPDPADDNNKFAVGVKAELQKNIDYYTKPQGKK
jgi:tetratricopeptide (TPR) repeat protein